jgi:D-cysteine desulfhydrase
VLAVGSGCTTAGLLAGFHLAHELGLAERPPKVTSVRVTPWPVTSRLRLANLAHATLTLVDNLRGASSATTFGDLVGGLDVDGRWLGKGYGRATPAGARTMERMRAAGAPPVDAVYTAKAAAALLELVSTEDGPIIFWATKSSQPLPRATDDDIAAAPRAMRAWMGRC